MNPGETAATRPRIVYFPAFDNAADLCDHIGRAAWYLGCMDPETVVFPLAAGMDPAGEFRVPAYMDDAVQAAVERIKSRIRIVAAASTAEQAREFRNAHIVLQWRLDDRHTAELKKKTAACGKRKQVWSVDRHRSRFEGSHYIKAGIDQAAFPGIQEAIADCRVKFARMAAELGRHDRSYLFLTGPTSAHFREFDYAGGLSIVCNSTIFDDELIDTVRPKIITFADSIFHFGVSQYAAAFRRKLAAVLQRHEMYICIPFNHYRLFTYHFPEYEQKTIGIPFDYGQPLNLDLNRHFYLNPYKNILLILMLPLATTFSTHVHLVGADGRKRADDHYFWAFNEKTQINDKLANVRETHPAFFDLDYNEYYDEHTASLADFLHRGRLAGKSFRALTPSFIPCLREGYVFRGMPVEAPYFPLVSVVMPCHNNDDTVAAAVASVQEQDYPNWELIVVDEASDRKTRSLLRRIAAADKRITVIHKEQKNAAAARNRGIAAARGEYVAFLDADDVYFPGSLSRRMERIVLDNLDAVCCRTQMLDEHLNRLEWPLEIANGLFTFRDLNSAKPHISSLILKKEILLANDGFDESDDFFAIEDLDLLQRITRTGVTIWNTKNAETGYRQNPRGAVFQDYQGHSGRVNRLWDIIFSEDPRVHAPLPEYRSGLGAAQKAFIQTKRQLQVLTWLIISHAHEAIDPLCASISPRIAASISAKELETIVRNVIVRYHRCKKEAWRDHFAEQRNDFLRICGCLQLPIRAIAAGQAKSAANEAPACGANGQPGLDARPGGTEKSPRGETKPRGATESSGGRAAPRLFRRLRAWASGKPALKKLYRLLKRSLANPRRKKRATAGAGRSGTST